MVDFIKKYINDFNDEFESCEIELPFFEIQDKIICEIKVYLRSISDDKTLYKLRVVDRKTESVSRYKYYIEMIKK